MTMHSTESVLKLVMTMVTTMMMTRDFNAINGDYNTYGNDDDYDHDKW